MSMSLEITPLRVIAAAIAGFIMWTLFPSYEKIGEQARGFVKEVANTDTVCNEKVGNRQVVCGLKEAGTYKVEIRASCTYDASYYNVKNDSMAQKTHHADGFPCKRSSAKGPVIPWSKRRAYYPDESKKRLTGEAFILVNGKDVGRLLRGDKHSLFGEFTTNAPASIELIVNEDSGKDGKSIGSGYMNVVIQKVSQ